MKSTLFHVCIQQKLSKLFQNPLYNYDVSIFSIIKIDKNVIQIHDDKDIKLFSKDLIDVFLEAY